MAALETQRHVRAEAKWVRTSPRKARLVAEHIRGRSVPEARTVLAFTPRAAARELEKVLKSAIANAEANHGLVGDDLYVSSATVDGGPTLKRWRARARGRAARIRKRTCHITIQLAPIPEQPAARAVVEEKPARRPRTRKPPAEKAVEPAAPTAAEDAPAEDAPAAEGAAPVTVAEAKPKPRRARSPGKKATEEAES
jgi:ribosomal protein L22